MRAKIIRELEASWNNIGHVETRKLLAGNAFIHLDQITATLYKLVIARLKFTPKTPGFKGLFRKKTAIGKYLTEGDLHYVELIRNSDILNEHNNEFERLAPLTEIISDVCLEIDGKGPAFKEGLWIYSVLSDCILEKLGQMLAADPEFQTYSDWQKIDKVFRDVQDLYAAWIYRLSVSQTQAENIILDYRSQSLDLNELAILEGFSRRNKDAVQNYLELLTRLGTETPVEYVKKACINNEMAQLKPKYELIERLLLKTSLKNWIVFLDAVYYPNVQDNIMLSIQEIGDFPELIRIVRNLKKTKSKKEHLLLIVLNTFYEYMDRTLLTLNDFNQEKVYPKDDQNKLAVASLAELTYLDWTENLVPKSVDAAMSLLMIKNTDGEDFFRLLFDWVTSYDRTHVPLRLKSRIAVQDCLHETLSKMITEHKPDLSALVKSFSDQQINWNTLSLLREQLLLDPLDHNLREILYQGYLRLMQKSNFHYTALGDTGLEVILNNAYYFSTVLAGLPDPKTEWEKIYDTHQLHYQGWLRNRHDGRLRDTETYMHTVAVGLAYCYYSDDQLAAAAAAINNATDLLVSKCRLECEDHTTLYELPLQFLAVTVSKYDPPLCGSILETLIKELDHLELLFHFCSQVPEKTLAELEPGITKQLLNRIEREFWIIENTYKRSLRSKFDYYKVIKEKIETV